MVAAVTGGSRVLVVDDEPLAARTAAAVLTRSGFEVEHVLTAAAARAAVASEPPDVVILDRHLGGDDGIELAAELRAARPALRILLVSGDPVEPGTAGVAGVIDRCLLKPVPLRDLVAAVSG